MSEVKIYPTASDDGRDDCAITITHEVDNGLVLLSLTGWWDGEGTRSLYFEEDRAIKVADAIYEQAGRSKPQADEDYNEAALKLAVDHDLRAKFDYVKEDNTERTVRLWPESVEDGLVVGFDHDRDDTRQFRLDRIQGNVVIG